MEQSFFHCHMLNKTALCFDALWLLVINECIETSFMNQSFVFPFPSIVPKQYVLEKHLEPYIGLSLMK